MRNGAMRNYTKTVFRKNHKKPSASAEGSFLHSVYRFYSQKVQGFLYGFSGKIG